MWHDRERRKHDGLAWIDAGQGPRVLLIHGVGLKAEAWAAQIDALSVSNRVLAVDMPGHGESAPLPGSPILTDYTDALAGLLTREGPAVVAGHSMGALLAMDLAVRYRGLVTAVMPCNAIFRRAAQAAATVQARALALAKNPETDRTAPLARWFPDQGLHEAERAACGRWLGSALHAGYAAAYTVFAHSDGPEDAELEAITCPATFLTGELEPNSTPAMSRALAALVPGAETEIVPGSYHMTPMTHPDPVNRALVRLIGRRFG